MQELLIQSLEIDWSEIDARDYLRSIHGMTGMPFVCGESPQGAQLPANPIATCKVRIVRCGREEAIAKS